MEVCILGTASGLPARDRFGQTIVLTVEESGAPAHYLLDVGDGASSLLMRHGFDHRDIRGIFISHMHADHHGGFAQVVKTAMHIRKESELIVLAPDEGVSPLKAYLEASYLLDAFLGYPVRWILLGPTVGREVALPGGLALRACPNAHLAWYRERILEGDAPPPRPYTFESYSAVLRRGGKRLVYAGNLNGPQGADEMAPFVAPCDLLIMELAHVDPTELGRFLAGRAIQETVVTHFHPKWDTVSDAEILARIRHGAGETGLRGRVTLARDGDRFPVVAES
jgi:ribonuclease BN (tRNA processing enzyme)